VSGRAAFWNQYLWNFASRTMVKPYVQEQFGGRWLTFRAAWHPGDKGPQTFMATEAFRLADAAPIVTPPAAAQAQPQGAPAAPAPHAPPPGTPSAAEPQREAPRPPAAAHAPQPAPAMTPALIPPYPGTGAYKTNAAYITSYQTALTWLAKSMGVMRWDPGGIDGTFGPHTQGAVSRFQADNGIAPVDGEVGTATAAKINSMLGVGTRVPA
jgi:peptidoglycan hydrolase-like protein with peptidoglycan-binding domain